MAEAGSMVADRIAALAQTAGVVITLSTANRPIDLWFIDGPLPLIVGAACCVAAVISLQASHPVEAEAALAGLTVTYWVLRTGTLAILAVSDPRLITATAVHALLVVFTALYYARSMRRAGFHRGLDRWFAAEAERA